MPTSDNGRMDEGMKEDVLRAFGTGKTRCPGQHIALIEVQLFVIELLLKTNFHAEDVGLPIDKAASSQISARIHLQIQSRKQL
jgi:cytochrome P450